MNLSHLLNTPIATLNITHIKNYIFTIKHMVMRLILNGTIHSKTKKYIIFQQKFSVEL